MSSESTDMKLKFSSYEIFVILILTLTQFTVVLDFIVISPLGDLLMKSMNLSTTQFGLSVSAYAFSAGFSGLITAGFADRFDRKKLLLFFYHKRLHNSSFQCRLDALHLPWIQYPG